MKANDWIKPRIAEAKLNPPLISEPVLGQIQELLVGQLSERELPKGELANIAKALIDGMTPLSPRPEGES